jgi:hypothetical protein
MRPDPVAPSDFDSVHGSRRGGIIITMILLVWFQEGQKQEKWVVLVFVDVADRGVGQRIHAVAGQAYQLHIVVVQHRAVCI